MWFGIWNIISLIIAEYIELSKRQRFFIISIIAGLFTLFIGYAFLATEPVGSSLLASGIGAIFMGSVGNWRYLGNIFRFLLLVISLIFLIWIALRLNKDKRKFKFWK